MHEWVAVPGANVVMRRHSERVATGGEQPRHPMMSLIPKVTFSENIVLLSLGRSQKKKVRNRRRRAAPSFRN